MTATRAGSARLPPPAPAGRTAAESAKRRGRGQARRRTGPLARLLSYCGGLLTLLTAAAALALLAEGQPADERPADGLERIAPAAAPPTPSAGPTPAAGAWLEGLPAWPAISGVRVRDGRLVLRGTEPADDLGLDIGDLGLARDADGIRLVGTLERFDLPALVDRLGFGPIAWSGPLPRLDVAGRLDEVASGGGLDVTVTSRGPAVLRLPAMLEGLPVTAFTARLTLAPDFASARLERLEVTSPLLRLEATADLARGDRVPTIRGTARIEATDAAALWPLWPQDRARGARNWVTANIEAGAVDRLDLTFDVAPERFGPEGFDPGMVSGTASLSGVEVHYLRPMRPVTDAAAEVVFDLGRMAFDLTGGRIDDVEVTEGNLVIRDYHRPGLRPRLELDVRAAGPVPTILGVTAQPPLQLGERRNLHAEGSAGDGTFRIEVALPLLRDLAIEDVDLRFSGDFDGVRLQNAAAGRDIDAARLRIVAGIDRVEVEGAGRLDGVPLTVGFLADAPNDVLRLQASGTVDAADLARLGLPDGLPVTGPVGLDAIVDGASTATEQVRIALDLTESEVLLPTFALWKPAGVAGEARARIQQRADGIRIDDLAITWNGADIRGQVILDRDGGLERAVLDPLRIAGTDARLEVSASGGHYDVRLAGARLDVGPLLDGRNGDREEVVGATPTASFDLAVTVDELVAGPSDGLAAVTLRARGAGGVIEEAHLRGRTPDNLAPFRLDLTPSATDGPQRLRVEAQDTGALLQRLGFSDDIEGGALVADLRIASQRPTLRAEGELQIDDFVLVRAPTAIRLLSQTPAALDLSPDAVAVQRSQTSFTIEGGVVRLTDASLIGSELAVNAQGSIDFARDRVDVQGSLAPVATLNRFLGSIPLIGRLLRGESGAGAFVVTFAVTGRRDDPDVAVNPLSILTPGVIRDLFAGTGISPSTERFSDRERD